MFKRIVLAAALAAVVAAESSAGGPFDFFRSSRRKAVPAQISRLRGILNSPKRLTELYGPSILVRVNSDKPKQSKFVTQPD